MKKEVDVLVIGAGPSGTIAASIINNAGYSVQMVEKLKFPRFVIGESLLPRSMEALEEAGLLDAVKARGFQQKDGAKFVMGDKICDFNFSNQYTQGWKWTWQVPRADFDKTLADECVRKGIDLEYEMEVTGIEIFDDYSLTTVQDPAGNSHVIKAKFIVDGSGYGRVIPRLFGLEKPSTMKQRKTIFGHVTDPLRSEAFEPNRIIIYVHNPTTWIWVIPFSTGITSLGYVGDVEFFEAHKGTLMEKFKSLIASEPEISARFGNSELVWDEPKTIESWSVSVEAFYGKGFVLTGNVTEFLDPVFSSGVTLAAVSAQMAAKLVIRELKGEKVDWESDYADPMKKGIGVFRTYVQSWYDGSLYNIFFAPEPDLTIRAQICSVLAGYVWDESNSFVAKHEKNVRALSNFLVSQKSMA